MRKYVLTELDIDSAEKLTEKERGRKSGTTSADADLQRIWRDLDPENDVWDRRLLYEVTGKAEFGFNKRQEDTSDEERMSGNS